MNKFLTKVASILIGCIFAVPMASAQKTALPIGGYDSPMKPAAFDEAQWGKMANSPRKGFFIPKAERINSENPAHAQAPWKAKATPEFRGVQIYADSWDPYGTKPYGVYEYTTSQPAVANPVFIEEIMNFNGGAVKAADILYGTFVQTNADGQVITLIHMKYNAIDFNLDGAIIREWEYGQPALDLSGVASDLVYDPVSGNIYGSFLNANMANYHFGVLNTGKMTSSNICNLRDPFFGMAVDASGQIYAITKKGDFGKVDKKTGEFTLIKSTGLHTENLTSAAIDPVSGLFYYIVCYQNKNSELYAIDCATGNATLQYIMPDDEEVVGMWFPDYTAEGTAPERPVIESVDFKGQSLSGSVTLATPKVLFDETLAPAGAKLSYSIYANGEMVQSGTELEYGQSYKISVAVPESGMYEFHAVVTNDSGASPESKPVYKWIGIDSPASTASVKLEYASGQMNISWDAVTIGEHQGAVGNVTYAIYSAVDSTLVAEAITGTSYSFKMEAPKALTIYQYYVVACSDGLESAGTKSNMISLGSFMPPYKERWANADEVALWTRIDGDGDDKGWIITSLEQGNVAGAWCNSHSYPETAPNDDWLITPAIYLEKGMVYTMNFNLMVGNQWSGADVKMCVGTAPTAEAMTQVIMPAQYVNYNDWTPCELTFIAETTGPCYIGVLCCSGQWRSTLYFNAFSISAAHNPGAPAMATDLNVVVPYDGEAKGTISYTAPTKAIDGSDLTSLTRVEVLVNNKIVFVDNGPVVGATSSVEYFATESGQYEFAVICYNEKGEGETARHSAYLGINYPAPPTNAQVVEVSDGVVNITWDATTKDIDGNELNPDLVKYDIYGYDTTGNIVLKIKDVEGTEVTNYRAIPQDYQGFVIYYIVAKTEKGSTLEPYNGLLLYASAYTKQIACGTPFSLPYRINFANGQINTLLGIEEGWGATWGVYTSASMGFTSRNNDNGFLVLSGPYGSETFYTGKIALEANAVVNYWYYGRGSNQQMDIYVSVDGERKHVKNVVMNAPAGEWALASVDLSEYAGKVVQLYFAGNVSWGGPALAVDDIYVGAPIKNDMSAVSISAPATVSTESDFNIEYTVKNWGTEAAKDYTVSLYADGDLVETMENLPELEPGESYTGTFSKMSYSLFEEGTYEFSFVVNIPDDGDDTNNGSQAVKVKVNNTDYPTVQLSGDVVSLEGKAQVELSWETPAIVVSDFDVVESFESEAYPSWTIESFGPWTLRNYNPSGTYALGMLVDYPNRCQPQGFTLFDYAYMIEGGFYDEWDSFDPYEGDRYMVAFAHTSGSNDSWLISNNLGGMAQQVKFFARSCDSSHQDAETMECYYSTTGNDKDDFIRLDIQGYESTVPFDWTEYTIDLPEGVQYFAIVSNSYNKFMLGIDNIAYKYTSPFVSLEIAGYNVYRDGELLNEQPIKELSYVDTVEAEGKYTYSVSVVYNDGKSAPSNAYEANVIFTSIESAAVASARVRVEANVIMIDGASKATVSSADGKVIYAGAAPARVPVAAGIYVVTADDAVAKVAVK